MTSTSKKAKTKKSSGRPPLFDTPDGLRARAEAYFDQLSFQDDGKTPREDPPPPTMARLALFLGFNHVQSLHEQADRKGGFPDVVDWCRSKIRAYHEEQVAGTNAGSFAWLRRNASEEWGEEQGGGLLGNVTINVTESYGKK